MTWRLAIVVLVGLLTTSAWAEDPPPATPLPPAKPAPSPILEQAADAVLSAVKAKDATALKGLAARDDPDPWLVADELLRRGDPEAAAVFARAAPRIDTEALPAYVASRWSVPDDSERRARLAAANTALAVGRPAEALDALGSPESGVTRDVVGVGLAMQRGTALAALARWDECSTALSAAAEVAERFGWVRRALRGYDQAGFWAKRGSAVAVALAAWERALAICAQRGDKSGEARTLGNIGTVHLALGDSAKALSTFERALATQEALGDRAAAAVTLVNIGVVHERVGDYAMALSTLESALAAQEALGDRAGAASALANIGVVHERVGDYAVALSTLERALAAQEALGDKVGAARTLGNIGTVHSSLGDYARALSTLESARARMDALEDRAGAVQTLDIMGVVHAKLGDHAKALSIHERVLATREEMGDKAGAVATLGNIGIDQFSLGDYARALSTLERVLAASETLGNKAGAAQALDIIGAFQLELGEFAKALSSSERVLAAWETLGNKAGEAVTLGNIGSAHHALGDDARALSAHQRALVAAEALGDRAKIAIALGNIGVVHFTRGDHVKALEYERRAVLAVSLVARGLGAEEGAGAREPHALAYDVGARAAVVTNDVSELAFFLESGRAGALLEGLKVRETLWSAAIPAELRAQEAMARAAEAAAMRAMNLASDTGDVAGFRARRANLEAAQEQVSAAIARIQREAKAGAALVYPEAATLDEIRATFVEGDALVLYGVFEKHACALVVTRDAARIVALGESARIQEAVEALALDGADADSAATLAALANLVVAPLSLPATTRRVLVSPAGALGYVPFAALVPGATVSYVPSGTTYRLLLKEQGRRGEGVLALGDPDYETKVDEGALVVHRGGTQRLTQLPGTREEAKAVGTVTLLGAEATEAGLRAAVERRPRWRAVHLACHGRVDVKRPALSSLALTAAGDEDGFLTALEVFRMKIPSDLVVLSACETGKGKVVQSEGIVGLTRAFMFAGAPRVIVSLWKVDDEATRALMVKFYELWNPKDGVPGLPTAEALRKAQEFVRSQEKWKHPYYWAAWVLWGLPS